MRYIKKIALAVVLLGLLGAGLFAFKVYNAFFSPNTNFKNASAYLYIPSSADFREVREQIAPLLEDVETFTSVAQRKGYISNIKGGKFELSKGMNNNDIINRLRSTNVPVMVSFNNQETLFDLAARIAQQIEADSASLVAVMRDSAFLRVMEIAPEAALGLYVPNKYEFFWNTDAEGFRDRMAKEYRRFWTDARLQKAKNLGMTPQEVVALAAIVHKETAKVDERPKVAGLYLNRIRKGMLLQADPTVIYAIKKETGNFDTIIKRVLYRDLEIESPYNTYKHAGVPPGPITMPDISAVDAVLNAENHDYYYMVADVSNFGYHMFARTMAQHNRNKEQYIRWINKQRINR